MNNKAEDIQQRSFDFACWVIRLYKYMINQDRANEILCRQLLRSATSIGANLQEADAAQSRADFVSKCNIALKEARESNYWLRLFSSTEMVSEVKVVDLLKESHELIAILTAIVKKSKVNTE